MPTRPTAPTALQPTSVSKILAEPEPAEIEGEPEIVPFSATPDAAVGPASGILPQLLNPITPDEAEKYLNDPNWGVEEKFDGKKFMIRKRGTLIEGINKHGQIIVIPTPLKKVVEAIPEDFEIDGEWVSIKSEYDAYDLLKRAQSSIRGSSCKSRHAALVSFLGSGKGCLKVAELVTGEAEKRAFIKKLEQDGKEGYVLKDLRASYTEGRPSEGGTMLKVKFWESGSFIVTRVNLDPNNEESKRSVEVGLLVGDGSSQQLKRFGTVPVPTTHKMPKVNDVVEVLYLYMVKALVQPRYQGVRDDVYQSECTEKHQRIKIKGKARPPMSEGLASRIREAIEDEDE